MNIAPIIAPIIRTSHGHHYGPPPTLTEVLIALHWGLILVVLMFLAMDAGLDGRRKRKQAWAYGLACWAWLVGGLVLAFGGGK